MKHSLLVSSLLVVVLADAVAQPSLTVEKIMQDQDTWIGSSPNAPSWSEDGETLYFRWNPAGEFDADSLYRVSREGGDPARVTPDERRGVRAEFSGWAHAEHRYDRDYSRKVFASDGDLYLLQRSTGEIVRLTRTMDRESSPRFTLDGSAIRYVHGDNVFELDLQTGAVIQLTDLRSGSEAPEREPADRDAWLEAQQQEIFDVLRERAARRERAESARDRERDARGDPPTYRYGDGRINSLDIDPTGRFVTFGVRASTDEKRTIVQSYVNDSGYAEDLDSRPKVGEDPVPQQFYIQDLARDTTFQVDYSTLPGAFDVVPAHRAGEGVKVDSSAARVVSPRGPYWSGDGAFAVLDVYASDQKDRWIVRLDPETGALTTLDRLHDDAWVGWHPGSGASGWLPDDRTFWYVSERSGFAHLYTVDVAGGTIRQITDGEFEVSGVEVSRDGKTWFLTTSEDSPHERHLYRMPIEGGDRVRLTDLVGNNRAVLHPDESRAAVIHSFTTSPPELYVQPFGRTPIRITHSTQPEWEAYPWRTGEIVHITASDGVEVPIQVFRPDNPNGAAVLFVHGAGYLQNVHRWWSSYSREYMFHNLLVDRGYTVVNVDYRASSGYGRDWRTAIYRHMGGRDLQDYVDASEWVGTEYGIDPERVFIYGGSYGGFMTLMALFTEPEHFGAGAALRSVTDWAHYNHGYTAAILNTPVTDSVAYARSSPINFADGLEDPLLMAHGVVDTNVQYQDIIRLTQRLIELGKDDWELASYPVEGHGFTEPTSWTDEYRRILELIERTVGPNRTP